MDAQTDSIILYDCGNLFIKGVSSLEKEFDLIKLKIVQEIRGGVAYYVLSGVELPEGYDCVYVVKNKKSEPSLEKYVSQRLLIFP
jgi:hypothetical protein